MNKFSSKALSVVFGSVLTFFVLVGQTQAGGFFGDLIENLCGGCGAGSALDDFHEKRLGNILNYPVKIQREAVVEFSGPLLAEAIKASRDNARAAGTKAIPKDIYQKLLRYYESDLLDKIRFRVGQGNELSVQANAFRFGDAVAVALIDTIVFKSEYDALYNDVLWAHEVKHIQQYGEWGLIDFAKKYVRSARSVEEAAYGAAAEYSKLDSPDATPPIWFQVHGELKHVSVQNLNNIWGVNKNNQIWRWKGNSWEEIPGTLKQISISSEGEVWGVNRNNLIFKWNGSGWNQMPGTLKYISVGSSNHIWGVNKNNQIWRWNGSGWDVIPGTLKQISVSSEGEVWGVNRNNLIYRWNGNGWTQIPGTLTHVSVGSGGNIWGVNSKRFIYRYNGSSWDRIPGRLKQIHVAANGVVFGTNSIDSIYTHR